MTASRDFWELYAGGAACTLALLRAGLVPPTAWMGGKRALAPVLLELFGRRPGEGAQSVLLADPGEWGWVWPCLLDPKMSRAVAAILRGWQAGIDEGEYSPEALWKRLAAAGPPADLVEGTAGWLWLQGRALGGWPPSWSASGALLQAGPRPGIVQAARHRPPAADRTDGGVGLTLPGLVGRVDGGVGLTLPGLVGRVDALAEASASWLVLQQGSARGRAVEARGGTWHTHGYAHVTPASKAKGFTTRTRPGQIAADVEGVAAAAAGWLFLQSRAANAVPTFALGGRWAQCRSGSTRPEAGVYAGGESGSRGRVLPGTLARRLPDRLPTHIAVYHGRAEDLPLPDDLSNADVLLDPPYRGCTGYGHDTDRAQVLALALDLVARGANVAICEAVGLAEDLPGWHQADLTPLPEVRRGPEWVTSSKPIPDALLERIGRSRVSARVEQLSLLRSDG